jgi:4-amino-4-deoxy-L-arabinose transferase-like glycosyltransferase
MEAKRGSGAPRLQLLAGAVSAGLMALCPLHVWYSQEVRMYALQTLLVTASWWLLFISLERPRLWIGYALAAALSLYAQYTSVFALAAQWIYVLWFRRDVFRPWVLAQTGVALLFAPCVPLFMHHLLGGTFGYWLGKFSWTDPFRFLALLSGAIPKNPGPYWPWVTLSIGLLIVSVIRQGKKALPLLLWLLAPVLLLALASLRANAFLPRVLLMVTPSFALLVGCAAADKKGAVLAVALAAANLFALQRYYFAENLWTRSSLREAAQIVGRESKPSDAVMHSSRFSYRSFQFYLGDNVTQGLVRPGDDEPALYRVIGNGQLPSSAPRRIWLVLWPDFQQPGFHNQVLAEMNARRPRHREVFSSPQLLVMLYD